MQSTWRVNPFQNPIGKEACQTFPSHLSECNQFAHGQFPRRDRNSGPLSFAISICAYLETADTPDYRSKPCCGELWKTCWHRRKKPGSHTGRRANCERYAASARMFLMTFECALVKTSANSAREA